VSRLGLYLTEDIKDCRRTSSVLPLALPGSQSPDPAMGRLDLDHSIEGRALMFGSWLSVNEQQLTVNANAREVSDEAGGIVERNV
jgi:hypothetical protein